MNTDKIYCPQCGREIEKTWSVCPYCGYTLEEISFTPQSEPDIEHFSHPSPIIYISPQKSHSNAMSAAAVIILLIILVPLMLWYIFPSFGINVTTGAIKVIYHSVLHNNVEFYIDGEYKGEYPSDVWITFNGIQPGTHIVRATTVSGTYLDEKTVEMHAGETVTVELSYLG